MSTNPSIVHCKRCGMARVVNKSRHVALICKSCTDTCSPEERTLWNAA